MYGKRQSRAREDADIHGDMYQWARRKETRESERGVIGKCTEKIRRKNLTG